jgi:hypothetical protein
MTSVVSPLQRFCKRKPGDRVLPCLLRTAQEFEVSTQSNCQTYLPQCTEINLYCFSVAVHEPTAQHQRMLCKCEVM